MATDSPALEIAVAKAATLDGWMYERELRWLAEQAQGRETIIEVGSWKGRSTKVLAECCPGTVWSVDDLTGQLNEEYGLVSPEEQDRDFRANLSAEIRLGKVKVVRAPSIEAAEMFDRETADMVFIDGGHFYPDPLNDILAWAPVLRPGGLLCGHDWTHDGIRQSCAEAPGEYEAAGDYEEVGSIWVRR